MLNDISDIRIEDFIMSLSKNIDNDILKLKEKAIENNVPIIRDDAKEFLILMLYLGKPKEILEIGTAIGYSTMIINKYTKNSHIITIEDYKERYDIAKKNLINFKNIELVFGDAGEYLAKNSNKECFDFVFLDAAKAQYVKWLPDIKSIMNKNAILVADNIFKEGEILESKFLIKKRNRTIHKRMRDFLYNIKNDNDLETYIFNIGDGISISIKK